MPELTYRPDFTYDRKCNWCKPSPYIKYTTISEVKPAHNADKLEIIRFADLDYEVLGAKGLYSVGQRVVFLPGETILPRELSDLVGVTQYLSKGRVKTIKLRGNRSEGLIVTPEQYQPFEGACRKWEDRPVFFGKGRTGGKWSLRSWLTELVNPLNLPTNFPRFYDMPNLRNEPYTFQPGERVAYSEKIHGMNARFGYIKRNWKWWAKPLAWFLGDVLGFASWASYGLFIGSHNVILDVSDVNAWTSAYRKFLSVSIDGRVSHSLPPDVVLYGEVFGKFEGQKIQHLTYGREDLDLRMFAAYDTTSEHYLTPDELRSLCLRCHLPVVEFHHTVFTDAAAAKELSEAPSELTSNHHREGIVLCSLERRCKFAKVISFKYLECNDRTEGKA